MVYNINIIPINHVANCNVHPNQMRVYNKPA